MAVINIGPCEYNNGGGCVRDTYLEALERVELEYGKENVAGGPISGTCYKLGGIRDCGQCEARAKIVYVDPYAASIRDSE